MKHLEQKQRIISQLVNDGFDFSKNVYQLSGSDWFKFYELSKKVNYKGTKNHSRGFSFYIHLQKIYNKQN